MLRNISLSCIAGPHKGQTFRLNGGPVFIFGRYSKATCPLSADPAASHLHFIIDTSEDRIRVADLGSTNGIVINERHFGGKQGKPFTDFVPLKSGDTLLAGACLFRLSVVDETTVESSLLDPSGNGATGNAAARPGNLTAVISKDNPGQTVASTPDDADPDSTSPLHHAAGLPHIDGYTIIERIGGGGKGAVYRAIKDDSGVSAAVKMMIFNRPKSKKQRSIEMFRREIQMTKQLRHPNIIRYLGDGIANGAPYLAIEYVDGGNLEELIQASTGGRMDLPAAIPLFIQLLEAVSYMHMKSLVHRDIKPKNILLDVRRGGSLAVKLSDMGLSCRFSTEEASEFLPIISEGGTPAYMPPEQLTDFSRAFPQSDVFSSAATFYHMLTGSMLYDFDGRELNEAILQGEFQPILARRPDLPLSLAQVITKSLSFSPSDRYPTAAAMLDAFKAALA